MDPSLTRTGVIATILSLIFAAAAFYVQHRKNSASRNKLSKVEEDAPHVSTTRAGQAKEHKRQSRISEESMITVDEEPATPEIQPSIGPKPIFKKYTTSGTQEEHPGLHNDDEALWE